MKKRMILMLGAVAMVLAAITTVKVRQIQAAIASGASFQPPPEAVTTIVTRQEEWPETLSTIGTVVAVHGVTVSADLPGIIDSIAFDSGSAVKQGDVLVTLDARQERAQLVAAEAQDALAHVNLERLRGLREQGIASAAEYDQAVAFDKQADAKLVELHATIDRKQIRAPFSGILGIRQVNLGQYLNAGEAVVSLQSLNPIYVNFAVPQQEIGRLGVGRGVLVTAEAAANTELTGKITAIDSIVDQGTRNIQIQATLANPKGQLRPGMFVKTLVTLGDSRPVVAVPASAINYAPYGDSVFVVADLKGPDGKSYKGAQQQFVKLGPPRGDQVAVVSGVDPGSEIVTSGAFKLRNGAAIRVNNEIQPANNPNPRPEDN